MSARAHGGIGSSVGPRGGCRGGGSSGGDGSSGAAAAKRRAKRRQRNPLSLTVFLDVPSELRGSVIGRQGATIKMIQERSGAVLKVPPAGRNGRIKVMGVEASLLAACREICKAVSTKMSHDDMGSLPSELHDMTSLGCTVDAGQLGRLIGKLYLPETDAGSESNTLLCQAETAPANTPADSTSPTIAYTAHAIPINSSSSEAYMNACSAISQDDIDITTDNYIFAIGGETEVPVSACLRNKCIFVSGISVGNRGGDSILGIVEEMKKLVDSSRVPL